ncbi:MAG: hypothetical protein ACM309_02690 [Bacillota bacterium]
MEFQITATVDWIGDDGSLDEAVKNEIVERIVKTLSKDAIDGVTKAAQRQLDAKLDSLISETYETFVDRGITITDQWGEPLRKNIKIRDLLKEKLDRALDERVDENGNTSSYRGDRTRLNYLIDKRVKWAVDEVTRRLDKKIEERLNEAFKEKLSASLLAKIDVEAVVKDVLGKLRG